MPEYADRLQTYWQSLMDWARQIGLPLPTPMSDGNGEEGGGNLVGGLTSTLRGFASSIVSFLLLLVLTMFFMLLMLGEGRRWREKAQSAFSDRWGERVVDATRTVARKVRVFLLVRTVVSLISGVVAGVWLWLVGVDLALVWGLLFFVMNYIPNIGSIIAGIPPILIALMQFGPVWAAVAAAGLIAIEQVFGNYLDPKIQGRNLDISPLIVLVSVIFWGWVWGIVGALIAVPMTVSILIACSRIPALRPLALLLSSSADFDQLDGRTTGG
jgi:AI-2 transport protein TqsA